jgi:predicted ferric reductase
MNSQVWWFVSRSSGMIAWALITLSVCWGLFVSTKAVAKASTPSWLLDLHRFFGGLAVSFTAIHLIGLWADSYVEFGWAELFVPLASEWKPGPVAWGIVSMYLLVAVEATSLAMRWLPRRLWRWVHHLSLPLYVMATYHGIVAGTDKSNQVFRLAALASVNVVAFLSIVLILAARRTAIARHTSSKRTPRPVVDSDTMAGIDQPVS